MKLRIRGNSLRLRLTQPEIQALIMHCVLEDKIRFAPELAIVYRIVIAEEDVAPKVSLGGHSISVIISKADADT